MWCRSNGSDSCGTVPSASNRDTPDFSLCEKWFNIHFLCTFENRNFHSLISTSTLSHDIMCMFNTPRVRPASQLCARSRSTVRAPVSRVHRQHALMPLLRSPCLGPGVRRSRFVLCWRHRRHVHVSAPLQWAAAAPLPCHGARVAFHALLTARVRLHPVPPQCSFVRCTR